MKFKSAIAALTLSTTGIIFSSSNSGLDNLLTEDSNIDMFQEPQSKKPKKKIPVVHKKKQSIDSTSPTPYSEALENKTSYQKSNNTTHCNNSQSVESKEQDKNNCPDTKPELKVNAIAAMVFNDTTTGTTALANILIKSGNASLTINANTLSAINNEGNSISRQYFDAKQTIISDIGSISAIGNYTQITGYSFNEIPVNTNTFTKTKDVIKSTSVGFLASQNFANNIILEIAPLFHSRNGNTQDSFWGIYLSPEYIYKIEPDKEISFKLVYDSNNLTLGHISDNVFDSSRPTNYKNIVSGRLSTHYDRWIASATLSLANNNDTNKNDSLYGCSLSYKSTNKVEFFAQYEKRQENNLYMIGVKTIVF
jgi:hypothetical protein